MPKTKLLYTLCSKMQPPERENSGCFASRRGKKPHKKKTPRLTHAPAPRNTRDRTTKEKKTLRSRSVVSGEVLKWPVHPELATIDALKTRLLLRRSRTFWKTSRQASSRTSRLSWLTLSPKGRALALSSSVVASPGAILPLRGLAALVLLVLSDPRSRALDQPAWVVLAFHMIIQNFGGTFHFSLFNR